LSGVIHRIGRLTNVSLITKTTKNRGDFKFNMPMRGYYQFPSTKHGRNLKHVYSLGQVGLRKVYFRSSKNSGKSPSFEILRGNFPISTTKHREFIKHIFTAGGGI